jgi:hypothetical protein
MDTADGRQIEVASVGNEGLIGVAAAYVSGARNPITAYTKVRSGTSAPRGARNRHDRTAFRAALSKPDSGLAIR